MTQQDLTLPDGAVRLPLYRRDGSIVAHAIVDADDAEWANQWRWRLMNGYAMRTARIGGRWSVVGLHRELLGLTHGDGWEGDHIDRVKLNCRRFNLRALPKGKNPQNMSSHRDSTSSHRGVCWDKRSGKWFARVRIDGKVRSLGRFSSEEAAAEAVRLARLRDMPYAVD